MGSSGGKVLKQGGVLHGARPELLFFPVLTVQIALGAG